MEEGDAKFVQVDKAEYSAIKRAPSEMQVRLAKEVEGGHCKVCPSQDAHIHILQHSAGGAGVEDVRRGSIRNVPSGQAAGRHPLGGAGWGPLGLLLLLSSLFAALCALFSAALLSLAPSTAWRYPVLSPPHSALPRLRIILSARMTHPSARFLCRVRLHSTPSPACPPPRCSGCDS